MAEHLQQTERTNIPGWGSDMSPKRRPAVSKEKSPARFINPHWDEPEQQVQKVKIYHSTERPALTPVFGTSTPPTGLSGKIRDVAYRLSENDVRHWLLLLFADRVNVVEGLLKDLSRGHVPNILAEMGVRSELKFNRRGAIRKGLFAAGIVIGLAMLQRRRKA